MDSGSKILVTNADGDFNSIEPGSLGQVLQIASDSSVAYNYIKPENLGSSVSSGILSIVSSESGLAFSEIATGSTSGVMITDSTGTSFKKLDATVLEESETNSTPSQILAVNSEQEFVSVPVANGMFYYSSSESTISNISVNQDGVHIMTLKLVILSSLLKFPTILYP